ncbi:MAG: cache domain-containing protein, partial [Chloroflexi bacterium]|nr:cache domain-containing protein [Chloroflexota bacterium]
MTATLRSFTSSLRARIMLLVVLSTVPVFVLMLFNADELRHESANEASAEALRVSRLAADQQERVIEGTRHLLLALAPSGALRTSNTELCNALTARVLTESPSYANIGAVNVRGETFCSALPVTAPANVADRSWFRRALATGGLGVGEYQLEPATNRASINVGYPFRDADGAVRGVVFAALDLAWLSTAADGLDLTAGSVLTVTDRDGTVLMRYPNDDDWLGRRLPAGDLPPALFSGSGHGTAIVSPSGGAANLIGFATVNGLGEGVESVILSVPAAQAFAKVDDLLRRNLATLTLGAALVVALAWGFSEKLVLQRVKALAVAAGRLAAGELTTRTGLAHGSDELGNLARSFDEMADSLQTLHDDLEQRVHQRTMELEESNARLALVNRDLEEQISERKGAEAALDRQNAVLAAVMR